MRREPDHAAKASRRNGAADRSPVGTVDVSAGVAAIPCTFMPAVDRVAESDLELVDPSTLHPHPENPRRHDDATIRRSIEDHGLIDVCVVQRSSRTILGGHGRWENGVAAGATRVPVLWVDCDDDEAEEILLVLNRSADNASYDNPVLSRILSRIKDSGREVARTGWGEDDLRRFVARTKLKEGAGAKATEDDADLKLPDKPRTKLGDVWQLGAHRLVCGDALDRDVVAVVLDGRLADLVWTDPPYGVSYVGKTDDELTIEGDGDASAAVGSMAVLVEASRPGAVWYLCAPSGPWLIDFAGEMMRLGVYRQQLVWVKDRFVLGHSDFHMRHESLLFGWSPLERYEPLLYGWTPGAPHEFLGDRTHDSVLEFARPSRSVEHPTMKPVALVGYGVELSSFEGDLVLDVFAGSGSTLVACEQLGRVAALVELDPAYCDVIVSRFEQLTGLEAVLA